MLQVKQFGRYEIICKLGRGMTDVYLAFDPADGRRAVLKIIEQSPDPWTQIVLDAEQRGALIQRQLHEVDPRFPEIYDCGESGGCYFVAMEYVEGKSVAEILQSEGRIDAARAARYAVDVCSQLARLHSFEIELDGRKRAVVHGDIKPSNIQICPDGRVRLLDFGISKAITFTRGLTHHSLGSPNYCSPERLRRSEVDPQSDLWALGATLYEMIAGFPPYQAQTTQKLGALIRSKRPPRALPDDCPVGLRAVTRKALAGEMHNRYPSVGALEDDLRLFLAGQRTIAESEKQHSWEANPTIEKARRLPRVPSWDPLEFLALLRRSWLPITAVAASALVGALLYVEATYAYRFWVDSRPLMAYRDYRHRTVADIDTDWNLYTTLHRRNLPLGRFSPVASLKQPLHSSLVAAADDVLERYRNSSNAALSEFDWKKAQVALQNALALDSSDSTVRGKLAVCNGYLALLQNPPTEKNALRAKANFEEAAAYLPRSPDPHLGLARLYVYPFRNVGKALAELSDAERLGYKPGPREFELQADGYLFRAEQELQQAEKPGVSRLDKAKYLSLAQGDLERARNLYEPIAGYSNVTANLNRLYRDRDKQQSLAEQSQHAQSQRARMRRAPAARKYASGRLRSWR